MRFSWQVDNIKCGGCANRIRQQLLTLNGVEEVRVDVEQGMVHVEADDQLESTILARLKRLGYPLHGSASGLAAVEADVRSVVSCDIGRLNTDR